MPNYCHHRNPLNLNVVNWCHFVVVVVVDVVVDVVVVGIADDYC